MVSGDGDEIDVTVNDDYVHYYCPRMRMNCERCSRFAFRLPNGDGGADYLVEKKDVSYDDGRDVGLREWEQRKLAADPIVLRLHSNVTGNCCPRAPPLGVTSPTCKALRRRPQGSPCCAQ